MYYQVGGLPRMDAPPSCLVVTPDCPLVGDLKVLFLGLEPGTYGLVPGTDDLGLGEDVRPGPLRMILLIFSILLVYRSRLGHESGLSRSPTQAR